MKRAAIVLTLGVFVCNRRADRGNCNTSAADRRQTFNLTAVFPARPCELWPPVGDSLLCCEFNLEPRLR